MSEGKRRKNNSKKNNKNSKIYCGNDDELPEGYDKMGTRFKCLQRGFGIGSMLEKQAKSEGKTKAIKRKVKKSPKIYCGDKHILPEGYDAKGTRYICLRKGVGAGIYTESRKNNSEVKEYKEMKEGKSDDHKRFGSGKKRLTKRSTKRKSSKKRSTKKKLTRKRSKKRSSKSLKKKVKKAKISSYNRFVKDNYTKVKKKYKLKRSEDVFIRIAKLWKRN
jgi:hypothetical protein